jgi:uncharacterized membrane protein YhhN
LGVFTVGDWVAVGRRWRPLEYVCKPAVMVVLLVVAARLDAEPAGARGWFLAALALSLAGDVFLMLPPNGWFVPGLGSFLLAHVCFMAGFAVMGLSAPVVLAGLALVAVSSLTLGGRVLRALGPSSLRVPVVAYMTVISVMVACALGTFRGLAVLGAALFYVSDALIAWNRFVQPMRHGKLAIIVTYHLAQFALVASLAAR